MAFSKEEAATRLASAEVEVWEEDLERRLGRLPGRLRDAAVRLLIPEYQAAYRHAGYVSWRELQEWLELSPSERLTIFEAARPTAQRPSSVSRW